MTLNACNSPNMFQQGPIVWRLRSERGSEEGSPRWQNTGYRLVIRQIKHVAIFFLLALYIYSFSDHFQGTWYLSEPFLTNKSELHSGCCDLKRGTRWELINKPNDSRVSIQIVAKIIRSSTFLNALERWQPISRTISRKNLDIRWIQLEISGHWCHEIPLTPAFYLEMSVMTRRMYHGHRWLNLE